MRRKYLDIQYAVLVFILFSFLIDSGGGFGLRVAGIIAMSALILINIKKVAIKIDVVALYFVMCLSFIPGLIVSIVNGVEVSDALKWFVSFYFSILFIILFFGFELKTIIDATILAGILYGLTQLALLLLLFLDFGFGLRVIDYFQSNAKGFIMMKETFEVNHPFVYLQATLSLVPIAILALHQGKYSSFLILTIILAVAQSRFGIFVLGVFFCLFYLKSRFIDLMIINLAYLIPLALLFVIYVLMLSHSPAFYIVASGMDVRIGHLLSIAKEYNVLNMLFGFGPGSLYFSLGANDVVDNIEVSQLEYIRKYGVIGSIMFFLPLYFILRRLYSCKELRFLVMSICSMFIVALSNPVLISMTFSWFLAIILYSQFKAKDAEI